MSFFASRWFKISISLTLLVLLMQSVDWRALANQIRAAQPGYFLLAFVGYLAGQVLSAYKWRLLARALGFGQSLRTFIVYYFAGMYLNLFAPSTIAGDFGRGVFLAGDREGAGRALQSVLADRLSGMLMLVWVSALGFLVLGPTVLPAVVCYGTIAVACGGLATWWLLPRSVAWLFAPQHVVHRWSDKLFGPYQREFRLLLQACGLALGFHAFQISLLSILAHSLGISVPFWYLVLCFPLVTLLSALPLSFGGLGVREGGFVFFLSFIGIAQDEALAFSLLWTGLLFGAGILGGLVFFLSSDTRVTFQKLLRKTSGE